MNYRRLKDKAWAFFCLAGIISIFSCEVGLGSAVDVEAPTSGITYPPKNAIVRDTFVAAGECKDDMQVSSVQVTVYNPDNNITYGPYGAELNEERTAWTVTLNQKDESKATSVFNSYEQWEIPDGNYIINAVAYDNDGKASPTASSPISIDNTAPVLVVSKPVAVGNSEPAVYGSYLKLTGDISEDHETSKLVLNYKQDNSGTLDASVSTIEVTDTEKLNSMSSSNPLIIAKYEGDSGSSEQHQNYLNIYGSVSSDASQNGEKIYYGGFQLEDNAKLYQTPGDSGTGSGNQTKQYYLLSEDLAVNYSLTAQRIKDILKGTSTVYSDLTPIVTALSTEGKYASSNAFEETENDTAAKAVSSKFSLSPNNNPTWSLDDYGVSSSTTASTDVIKPYQAGSSLILSLSAGRDGSYPAPNSVIAKLYDMGDFDSTKNYYTEALPTDPAKCILLIGVAQIGGETKTGVITNCWNESADDTVKNYTFILDAKNHGLSSNHIYRITVEGKDRNDVPLQPYSSTTAECKYMFKLATSSNIPTITFESPEDDKTFGVADTDDAGHITSNGVIITGSVNTYGVSLKSENQGFKVSKLTRTKIENSHVDTYTSKGAYNWTVTQYPSELNNYTFAIKIEDGTQHFDQTSTSKYRYVVTVQATNVAGLTGEKNLKFNVDNKKPEVVVSTVTPNTAVTTTAAGTEYTEYTVNGNIEIKGTASDSGSTGSGLKSLKYKILKESDDSVVVGPTSINISGESWKIEGFKTFDEITNKTVAETVAGDGRYKLIVTATDTVDNSKDSTPIILVVDQTKDTPDVSFSNADSSINAVTGLLSSSNNMFGTVNNNKLYGTVTDDDGIASVKVTCLKEGSPAGTVPTVLGSENPGSKSYNFEYELKDSATGEPLAEGEYKISVEVKDKYADTDSRETNKDIYTKDFYITIDDGAPEFVSVTPELNSSNYVLGSKTDAEKTLTFSVNARDGNGVSSLSRKLDDQTDDEAERVYSATWSDTITLPYTDGVHKVIYTAKDKYNQASTYEVEYSVDVTDPELYQIKVGSHEIAGTTSNPSIDTYIKDNNVTVALFVKDTGSGIASVEYSLDNGSTYSPMTSTNLEAGDLSDITDAAVRATYEKWIAGVQFIDGNSKTLKLRIKDSVGNKTEKTVTIKVDRTKPVLDVKWYQIVGDDSATSYFEPSGETAYVHDKNLVIYANYTDVRNTENGEDNSGITEPVFKIGDTVISPVITYYKEAYTTSSDTAMAAVMTAGNTVGYDETNAKIIKSFKAVIPSTAFDTAALSVSGSDNAGNEIENNNRTIISLEYDTANPVISLPNFPKAYIDQNGKYFVRRVAGENLVISGTSIDAVSLDKTVITITGQGTSTYTAETSSTAWEFNEINLNGWAKNPTHQNDDGSLTADATINITAYDKAGNTKSITPISLIFDEDEPKVLIGSSANPDIDPKDISDAADTSNPYKSDYTLRGTTAWKYGAISIGKGKYGDTTYGREASIEVGITYINEKYGSGIAKMEYKMLASNEVPASLKNTKTGKFTGTLPESWTKTGEFAVSAKTYTHREDPAPKPTYPCYEGKATIAGFKSTTNGTPNLLFVKATDNCGNESDVFALLIQMDNDSPVIVSDNSNPISLLTNGQTTLPKLTGSVSEGYYSAGLKAIRLYVDGKLAIDGNFTWAPASGLLVEFVNKKTGETWSSTADTDWSAVVAADDKFYNNAYKVTFKNDYGKLTYTAYAPTEAQLNSSSFTPDASTEKCSFKDAASYAKWEVELTPQNGSWFQTDLVDAGKTSPQITIEVEDWADDSAGSGNKATNIISSLDIDVTKPTATLLSPVGNSEGSLNGNHKIKGSVSENHTIKALSIYYSTAASAPDSLDDWTHLKTLTTEAAPSTPVANTEYGKSPQDLYSFALTKDFSFNELIGTAEVAPVHLLTFVEDEAGNTNVPASSVNTAQSDGSDAVKTYTVDLNSDRPVVTVTSATLAAENSEGVLSAIALANPLPIDTRNINITVSDDDGVEAVWYRINKIGATATEDWTPLTLTSGGAVIKFNNDGIHKLEFKVKDTSNAYTFASDETDFRKRIYLTDTVSPNPNKYGVKTVNPVTGDQTITGYEDPVLYLKIDTAAPDLEVEGVQLLSTAAETKDNWITEGYSNLVVGGPSTSFMKVKVDASDEGTGIKDVKISAKLDGDSVTPIASSTSATVILGTDSTYEVIIPCTISGVEKENVNFVVTLTAEDNAGKQRSQAITFKADTKRPVITVTSPLSTEHLSGSISAEGQISESTEVYYAISPIEDSPDTYSSLPASAWNYVKYDSSDNEITPAVSLPTTDKSGAAIPPSATLETLCAYQRLDESKMMSFYLWFDGKTDGSSSGYHSETLNTWIKNMGITTSKDLTSPSNPFDDMIKLYLHIKAIDSAGNKNELHYPIMLDPLGSRPTVTIGYPSAIQAGGTKTLTLGGAPTIIGTATGTNVVDYVWLQVDCDADGVWTAADFNTLLSQKDASNNAVYSLGKMDTKELVTTALASTENAEEYAIRIEPSGLNWVQQININGELNPAADSGLSTKAVKIWAYSTDRLGFISSQEKRNLIIDSESPIIDQDIKLVQWNSGFDGSNGFATDAEGNIEFNLDSSIKFATGAVAAVRSYNENENVKGQWYVIGKVSDSSGIKAVSYKVNGGALVKAITNSDASHTGSGANAGTYIRRITGKNYVFCLPIGNDTEDTVGEYSVEFSAEEIEDSNPKSAERTFSVRYDNKAPAIDTLLSGYTSGTLTIANSNGVYTFGGIASEDKVGTVEQTGIERIAFYFTRNITDQATKIFDPMIRTGRTGNAVNYSSLPKEYGLYWQSATVSTMGGTITVPSGTSVANIHKGGLVKINGVIHTITGVAGNVVSVDDNLGIATDVSASFAIANVIDNPTREGEGDIRITDDYGYGYFSNGAFDDGDYLIESLVAEGTKYTWEANINSKNISDGPATLHYVVFDKAGNTTEEKTIECFIKNNQPRLAGVMLGTDEDGNGSVEGTEFVTSYQNTYAQGYNGKNKVDSLTVPGNSTAASPKSIFKIKGKTVIRPEIVGGNGTVGYTYTVAKRNAANTGWDEAAANLVYNSGSTPVDLGAGTEEDDEGLVYMSDDGGIVITVKDFLQHSIADGENQKFTFTIWDSTPGLTYGTNSQSATLNVIMDVALNDETPAKNKIIPFYWKSSIENSLKDNDPAMGHIELSKDLPSAFTSGGTGIYSLNPKISGAVMLEGIAQDNTLLSSLTVTIDGTAKTIATYSTDGNPADPWTPASGTGWAAAVRNATYDELFNAGYITDFPEDVDETDTVPYTSQEYGHVVHWSMLIDTELMGIGPKTGIEISVAAQDKGKPTLTGTGDAATVTYAPNDFKYNGGADATLAAVLQSGGDDGEGTQTCKYKVDVVPYIRGIKTYLSGKSSKEDTSEYDRTALGHYPVANTEKVYVYGFNLAGGTLYDSKVDAEGNPDPNSVTLGAADSSTFADEELTVYQTSTALTDFISGPVYVKVGTGDNAIESINNLNDNDAQGDYGADLPETADYGEEDTYETFSNFYNRKPNTSNNYILTDDVELDVWKFNSNAAYSSPSGRIDEVSMKINPASDSQIIGFSFLSGSMHFSTPKGKTNSYSNTGGTGATGDFRTTSFLAYDWRGWSYALDAGGNEQDRVKFWIVNDAGEEKGSVSIEQVDQYGTRAQKDGVTTRTDLRYKVRSPSIVTSKADAADTTNMYMAYYDSYNDEIRYKCGTVNSAGTVTGIFKARNRNAYSCYRAQVIATDATTNLPEGAAYQYTGTPLGGAGEFVAIDVIPKGTIVNETALAKDVVVIVWYDVKAKALKYSYNENPLDNDSWQSDNATVNKAGTKDIAKDYKGLNRYGWEDASTIFDGAGEFCQVKVDAKGGVHIAAYDAVYGDLRYAYLPTYKTAYSEDTMSYTVDSTGNTGAYLILDVALDKAAADGGKGVPYISYWGGNMPKIAYMKSSAPEEGTYNDMFSGAWEVSYIPTTRSISDLDKKRLNNLDNRISVALWKDSDGVIKESRSGTSSAEAETGVCYGNGTAYPVVGYTIVKDSANDRIETAQMQ